MKIISGTLAALITLNTIAHQTTPYQAVVITPVADLIGNPLADNSHGYATIPLSGESPEPYRGCIRLHQLLFNEVVTVLQTNGDEVLVQLPNIFYVTRHDRKTVNNTFWTLKKNIMPLTALAPHDRSKLPTPIDSSATLQAPDTAVTLHMPWHDQISKRTFSAGTRFVRAPEQRNARSYAVYLLDPTTHHVQTAHIPKAYACSHAGYAPQEKVHNFVALLRRWATLEGTIPYVFGGASFTQTHNAPARRRSAIIDGRQTYYYTLDGYHDIPQTGLDCSGMIMRAAQIVGIPYFFKNSTTLEEYVPPLTKEYPLSEGDLIAIPGHVMVVASTTRNTLIEARHYSHGYGKLQEIPLNKVFKGINTYADLRAAYEQGSTLQRIDKDGIVRDMPAYVKLARIKGLFS